MTKDQYLRMVEQTGEEIDWDKCPPEISDFPDSVVTALNIYHTLGDRVYPDVGFTGKDYTNLRFLMQLYAIEDHQQDWLVELINWLEAHNIRKSQEAIKAEYNKLKKK